MNKMILYPFQYCISNTNLNSTKKNGAFFFHKGLQIAIHESNSANLVCSESCVFFGEVFDFENPTFTNQDIVHQFSKLSFEEKIEKLHKLNGFFIFIVFENDKIYVFNDAAGQLETYIYHYNDRILICSQPTLILDQIPQEEILDQSAPSYIVEKKINIFGKTPFQHIEKLIPNFYYDVFQKKAIRFFPLVPFVTKNTQNVSEEVINILEKTYDSLVHRKKIAIAVTAGWDSRILFATSLKHEKNIDYYVLNHQSEDGKVDVEISKKITSSFSKSINIIDYDLSKIDVIKQESSPIWKDEEKIHKMAHVMNLHYPDHYLINGNISEIARNFYDPLPKKLSLDDICFIIGIKNGTYEKNAIENWQKTLHTNVHVLDAIYWEHKMPNWAGSAKSISNLYNIVISPFNNRYLLALLLSTKRKERDKYFPKIYQDILQTINEKLIEIPINPTKKHDKIVLMKKIGIYTLYRNLFFKMRKLKF